MLFNRIIRAPPRDMKFPKRFHLWRTKGVFNQPEQGPYRCVLVAVWTK